MCSLLTTTTLLNCQRHTGTVSFKRLLERMFPEATSEDVKTLLHMARPKGYVPKAKPDQGVRFLDQ